MSYQDGIPDTILEQVIMVEGILSEVATGGSRDNPNNNIYIILRREFMSDSSISELLPQFVRSFLTLGAFWPFIQNEADTYAERRQIIKEAFAPLKNHLEGRNSAPVDNIASSTLEKFDVDSVMAMWVKALNRRNTDPEGAITVSRTLLETVMKHILDKLSEEYNDKDDLPKLYAKTAKVLKLAPNQHTEKPIKVILGNATSLVNGIGTLRNRFSDSHGRGGMSPYKVLPRHASLAVNTAGSVATFLVETFLEQHPHLRNA